MNFIEKTFKSKIELLNFAGLLEGRQLVFFFTDDIWKLRYQKESLIIEGECEKIESGQAKEVVSVED